MINKRKILFSFILVMLLSDLAADSWRDPEWKEMIYGSDLIALIEYSTEGDFRAKAKPLKIYKGDLETEDIWISGFSNRYGPIDTMIPGDRYIVFLYKAKPSKDVLEYWQEIIEKEPKLTEFYEAMKNGNAFYVPSPTSGDLKVIGGKVQYDLLQTTFYSKQEFYDLEEFEAFLNATSGRDKFAFHETTISRLSKNITNDISAQYVMMLYLTSYRQFNKIFEAVMINDKIEAKYALAKLLGQISGKESLDLLIKLLGDDNSLVQGEAVRQLSGLESEFIGPILLGHLKTSGNEGIYPSNVMSPVTNRIDGGKIEIVKALGEIKYKPAIQELLPLLETEDDYLFRLIIDVLNQLGSKDYVPYLNKHLEAGTRNLILDICFIITENQLEECVPSLMRFVSEHDKDIHPSMEYTISKYRGLAHFPSDTVKKFLYLDFLNVLKMKGGGTIDNKKDWVEEYIEVFIELGIFEAKEQLYNFMYEYYGFNHKFKLDTNLFELKKTVEDSISRTIRQILVTDSVESIDVLAIIRYEMGETIIDNYAVKIELTSSDNFGDIFSRLESNGFSNDHISLTTGFYTHSYGDLEIQGFGDRIMRNFLDYLLLDPDEKDIEFLKNLKKYNYYSSGHSYDRLETAINRAEGN